MLFRSKCILEAGYSLKDLDAVAVSKGPGSFTGLRIGVASAKGLCYALNLPLLGIDTLESMARICKNNLIHSEKTLFCPMLDARRMEVYTALFDQNLNAIEPVNAQIIDSHSFSNILRNQPVVFFGDGMPKCRDRKSTRLNSSHIPLSRMPSSA